MSNTPLRVLIVDDSADDAEFLTDELQEGGYDTFSRRVDEREPMALALRGEPWDLILCDHRMPRFSAPDALELLLELDLDLPFIVVSGAIGESVAVDMMRAGAHDYILKDNLTRLLAAVDRELRAARARREARAERELIEAQLRQSQKLEGIGLLAGGVAHDFNNHLMVIMSLADFLREDISQDSPLREDIDDIVATTQRAAELTQQLLAFSRRRAANPSTVDISAMLLELHKMLRRLMGTDIELSLMPDSDLWPVHIDRAQLQQVILNLMVNARDAMPDGGKLAIALENRNIAVATPLQRPGDYIAITVSDTGEGMTQETAARIFEPFFTTKDPGRGTGLGLATCYGIISQAGGVINVDSVVGSGTTFTVLLPRCEEDEAPLTTDARQPLELNGDETVLLVEDDALVRQVAVRALEQRGYTVISAGDGEEALRGCAGREQDLGALITDVVMPRLGGAELAQRLQSLNAAIKVLFISGYSGSYEPPEELRAGPWAFLQKPFLPVDLVGAVRQLLDDTVKWRR